MYDVTIVGGGIMGSALAYSHIALTSVGSVLLLEKNNDLALVNSHPLNNAETLHDGATETNMALSYALIMKRDAGLMAAFLKKYGEGSYRKVSKGVVGIGAEEIKILEERFEEFKPHYSTLTFLRGAEIALWEPKIMEGRKNPGEVVAILEREAYSVDYQKAARAFVNRAKEEAVVSGKIFEVKLNIKAKDIKDRGEYFEIETNGGAFATKIVIFAAGPYSLIFAHKLGFGKKYSLVPIAGDFYTADHLVDSKVYTVQPKAIPVARVHADPAVYNPLETRLGPTAKILPFLERHHLITFFDFIRTGILSAAGIYSLTLALLKPEFRSFEFLNMLYQTPYLGKWLFLKYAARHLFPALKYRDIRLAKGAGGIRPQMINLKTHVLEMGIGEIFGNKRSCFIVTPSPGASKALGTAIEIAKWSVKELGDRHGFDEKKFEEEFAI